MPYSLDRLKQILSLAQVQDMPLLPWQLCHSFCRVQRQDTQLQDEEGVTLSSLHCEAALPCGLMVCTQAF